MALLGIFFFWIAQRTKKPADNGYNEIWAQRTKYQKVEPKPINAQRNKNG